jgi:hypothetical protein
MSQPIEHSPGPWSVGCYRYDIRNVWEDRGEETAILGADGKSIVEMNPYGTTGTDEDLKLLAAAPTMYRIIRQICSTDWEEREQGLRSAQFLLQELEGRSDAES